MEIPAQRIIPAPVPTPDTAPFWAAAAQGRFLLRSCTECGKPHWYPRTLCPFCFSAELTWTEASGKGCIYSFSVMHRAEIPYAVAYVTLEEGPTMLTNIVGAPFASLAIGQPVAVSFVATAGAPVPCFTPVADAQ